MEYIEFLGVGAFAVSGAMIAIDREADIFGVIFLAIITALGGGVVRDMMLGCFPPRMFTSYAYILTATLCALSVFIDAYIRRDSYLKIQKKLDAVVNVFDALGLAMFTVSGMNIAIQTCGLRYPVLLAALGMTTGVGGGMVRDVLSGRMPAVLYKRIYAVASLVGALVYYALLKFGVKEFPAALISMGLIFLLRVCATRYRWNLPRIRKDV